MTDPNGRIQGRLGGRQPSTSLLALVIVVSGIGIGAVAYFLFGNDGDTSPPTAERSASPPAAWSETVTATATETITKTSVAARPPVTAAPPVAPPIRTTPAAPQPNIYAGRATIIGTCDEGGSCGVRQRTAPYTDAPSLYPSVLQDGTTVIATCQTVGDVRSNLGVGSSNVWYRLNTGAYLSAVYMTAMQPIPLC